MAKKKKLYYLPAYGQLGNQLATMAHLLAFAIEYDFIIVYPYSRVLSTQLMISEVKENRFRFNRLMANKWFANVAGKLVSLLFLNHNLYAFGGLVINQKFIVENDFKTEKCPHFIIVNNWLFRHYEGIKKHATIIRQQMAFIPPFTSQAQKKWLLLKNKFTEHTFIGVHVRRGDYATWLNGIFFYDDDTYYGMMLQMAAQTKKAVFIVCSNEELNFANTGNLNIIYAKGSPAEDLFLLSHCEYIFGPPSTFSSWAAFMGDRYLLQLEKKDDAVQLYKFYKFYL